jgi:hypothetical protein
LAVKPAGDASSGGGRGEKRVTEIRVPLSATAPLAQAKNVPGINPPPPPLPPGPSLESLQPPPRPETSPSLLAPLPMGSQEKKPRSEPTAQKPAQQAPPVAEKKDDDKPGLGLQLGLGGQTLAREPQQQFSYYQVSAEASNVYVGSLEGPKGLGPYLSRVIEKISFVGEPGLTLQVHAVGDSPQQVDVQFLGKLVQVSFDHVDFSAVLGAGYNDLLKKADPSRLALLGGLELEPKIKAGPLDLSLAFDGVATIPHYDKPSDAPKSAPAPSRRLDGQFSGEARIGFQF